MDVLESVYIRGHVRDVFAPMGPVSNTPQTTGKSKPEDGKVGDVKAGKSKM